MCQACYIRISCHCNKQDPFKLPILQMRKSSRKAITCPRSQSFLVRHRSIFLHRNGCIPSGPYFTCYCGHVSLLCLYYPANFPQLCSFTSTGFLVQGQVHCSNTFTGECIIPDKLTPKKGSSWTNSYANVQWTSSFPLPDSSFPFSLFGVPDASRNSLPQSDDFSGS